MDKMFDTVEAFHLRCQYDCSRAWTHGNACVVVDSERQMSAEKDRTTRQSRFELWSPKVK